MRRFFLELPIGTVPDPGDEATLGADEAKHLRTVLRLGPGDTVALTDGRGHALVGEIRSLGKTEVVVTITGVERAESEQALPSLHLGCAVVKGKRFEYALEKAVELGVHTITPLVTERGVIDAGAGKQDRWRTLLVTALKQSGRCHLPQLSGPMALRDWVVAGAASTVWFGAAPGDLVGEAPLSVVRLAAHAQNRRLAGADRPAELRLAVGPEGGWTVAELNQMSEAGAMPLNLGPHVLRTETAAVVGLAALQEIRRAWLRGAG